MSDMFEIKAIEMIARYLETAVFEPTNAEARNGMAVAQYIAGMAFSNVGLGVVHGMAHPLVLFSIFLMVWQMPCYCLLLWNSMLRLLCLNMSILRKQ